MFILASFNYAPPPVAVAVIGVIVGMAALVLLGKWGSVARGIVFGIVAGAAIGGGVAFAGVGDLRALVGIGYAIVFGVAGGVLGPLAVLFYRGKSRPLILGFLVGALAGAVFGTVVGGMGTDDLSGVTAAFHALAYGAALGLVGLLAVYLVRLAGRKASPKAKGEQA